MKVGENMELERLEASIGYVFKNKNLLINALTHTSFANENKVKSNEKLEFLGDSILEFLSSKYIYNNYKTLKEGEMTKVRADVVCEKSLYKVAQKHNFSDFLLVGKSQILNKGNERPAVLADCVEAVIAAIYFDSDLQQCEKFIIENLKDAIEVASKNVGLKDYKTVLQEKLQVNGDINIQYNVLEELGPDHDKVFKVEVMCEGKRLATGIGKNKKSAEMEAARLAL